MRLIQDILIIALLFILFRTGAAREAFDGAFFAYFRPEWEAFVDSLPQVIKYFL